MKKGFTPMFIISALLTFVIAMLGDVSTIEYGSMTVLEFILSGKYKVLGTTSNTGISYALRGNWFAVLLPLLVLLPKLFSFSTCIQSGFWRFNIIRTERKKLVNSYWLSVILNGALSVTAGYLLYALVIISTFKESDDKSIYANSPICNLFGFEALWGVLVFKLLILFLFASMTASICLSLYVLSENKYKSIGMPIIISYMLLSISGSIYRKNRDMRIYIISPNNLLGSADYWFESLFKASYWIIPLIMLVITFAMYIVYTLLIRRRLNT